ncbi:MAG: amidohydrolase [Hellea sp.]|nr:amidohydrolase [Hellea sp.]
MSYRLHFILSSALVMGLTACSSGKGSDVTYEGESCYTGGPIYTAIDSAPTVEAVRVKDGVIRYAGAATDNWCDSGEMINLAGSAMYPGFTDAHGHFVGIGLREMTLNLEGTLSIAELKTRVSAAIKDLPAGETLYGRGWIETHWPEKRFPNRLDLDEIAPDNPVILERADGHALVVNSAALKAANITADTEIPFGGDVLKDDAGNPTGMLIDKADALVRDLMPTITEPRIRTAMKKASDLYASRGWTNIHSMSFDPAGISLVQEEANAGNVKIRVYASTDIGGGFETSEFAANPDRNNLITRRSIKLYADGALGSRGAALLAPYEDDPENIGLMLTTYDTIMPVLKSALKDGVQVNTHAIGDKANRLVLDWYEEAMDAVPASERAIAEPRWRIEHSQIIALEDIPRFAKLGVIPSMQPSHAIGDLHFAVDRLGPERLAGGYAWRSLIDSGSIIAGGSDAPVEVGDTRIEFYAAVARKDLKGYSNQNWNDGEKVTRQEALKMFTIWPAYAAFEDDRLGTIEAGKSADFTVFDRDIMTIAETEILDVKTVMTIVNGAVVYSAKAN